MRIAKVSGDENDHLVGPQGIPSVAGHRRLLTAYAHARTMTAVAAHPSWRTQ